MINVWLINTKLSSIICDAYYEYDNIDLKTGTLKWC